MLELHVEGDSKEVLSEFPHDVKVNLGYALRRLQDGNLPTCPNRPMPSIGKGVFESKDGDERTWYRVIYLSVIDGVLYVLHCFEKDSRKTHEKRSGARPAKAFGSSATNTGAKET
jgi:phage-related protein